MTFSKYGIVSIQLNCLRIRDYRSLIVQHFHPLHLRRVYTLHTPPVVILCLQFHYGFAFIPKCLVQRLNDCIYVALPAKQHKMRHTICYAMRLNIHMHQYDSSPCPHTSKHFKLRVLFWQTPNSKRASPVFSVPPSYSFNASQIDAQL